jgi:undecaprenyl phosphate N,N'-diacetylbacillosamine 1-phosphate transferase
MKIIFDKVLSVLLMILLAPLLIVLYFLIKCKLGSPVLFKQNRPGLNEKIFTIYKFRSMTDERDLNGELLSDEKRLTTFGKTLRSLSLDELPQIFNVLKGEMSFIGPRALLIEYLPRYNLEQKKRHRVKPGITGWAQVNGRNAISWEKKFELDVWYVENQSFLLDMKIILLTVLKIIKRSDISQQDNVTMEKFMGSNK